MNAEKTTTTIEWRPEYETGIASIDHEHQEIINRLNRLLIAAEEGGSKEGTLAELGEIYAWISAHFALEEQIMRNKKYDQYDDHKDDHERLLDDISSILMDFENGSYGGLDDAFRSRLHNWFAEHFKSKDARLHRLIGG